MFKQEKEREKEARQELQNKILEVKREMATRVKKKTKQLEKQKARFHDWIVSENKLKGDMIRKWEKYSQSTKEERLRK